MAFSSGMNVGEVRGLAKRLDDQAGKINGELISQINGILSSLESNWQGGDFVKFKGWWETEHRPRLQKLAEDISGLAQSARNNAQEQENVSGR